MDFKKMFSCLEEATDEEISALFDGVISTFPINTCKVTFVKRKWEDFLEARFNNGAFVYQVYFNGHLHLIEKEPADYSITPDIARFMQNLEALYIKKGGTL